jgi:hypothetical protein
MFGLFNSGPLGANRAADFSQVQQFMPRINDLLSGIQQRLDNRQQMHGMFQQPQPPQMHQGPEMMPPMPPPFSQAPKGFVSYPAPQQPNGLFYTKNPILGG